MIKKMLFVLIGICLFAGGALAEPSKEGVYFDTPFACIEYFSACLNEGNLESALQAYDSVIRSHVIAEDLYADNYRVMMPSDALYYPRDYMVCREALNMHINAQYLNKVLQNILISPQWVIKEDLLSNRQMAFIKDTLNFAYYENDERKDSGISLQDYYDAMSAKNLERVRLCAVFQFDYQLLNSSIRKAQEKRRVYHSNELLDEAECVIVYEYENHMYAVPMMLWKYEKGWKIHSINSLMSGLNSSGEQIETLDETYERYICNYGCTLLYELPELAQKRVKVQDILGTWKVPLDSEDDQMTFEARGKMFIEADGRREEARYAINGPYILFVAEDDYIALSIERAQSGIKLDGMAMTPVQ